MQASVTGASSGAQEDAVKAEAKVQDLQGRLKIAEQEKAAAEKAQQVSVACTPSLNICSTHTGSHLLLIAVTNLISGAAASYLSNAELLST